MTTVLPTDPALVLAAAAELNALASIDDALPLFAERVRELLGADATSVIAWDEPLTEGRVLAAAGVAADRVGRRTRSVRCSPKIAIRSGEPQFGPVPEMEYGYGEPFESELLRLAATVSVPVRGANAPITVQAGWLRALPQAELSEAAEALAQLTAVAGIGRRTAGEQVRRDERARLEAVLDAAGDGILIERDGRWIANRAAQQILDLPDERVPTEGELNSRRLDGSPIRPGDGLPPRFRIRMTSVGGRELVLDGSYSPAPLPVIVFRDVTEEVRRSRTNEQFLRSLLDTIPTAICVVEEPSRRVLSTNRAFTELVGRSEQEVVGQLRPYPWWADGEKPVAADAGEPYPRVYRRPDGTPVPIEIELHDLHDADGRVYAKIGVITDLTERRRFEQQLVQSGKLAAIGELAAGVAHEVNNPLFAILGLVEFLLKDAEPGTKSHERLELIQSTALEIKEIVRALLDFAREGSNETALVALDEVIAETVELVRKTTAGHGVDIELAFGGGPFLVDGSPNQLKQIFLNLIGNARQAMPDGGLVTISLALDGDSVEAVVRDQGPGILPEHLQRIFEPFYTTKRGEGGTGLGLPVSVGIAERHGGSLTADSTPGRGAAFTLRLPRHR